MTRCASAGQYRNFTLLVAVIILYGSLFPFHISRSLTPGDVFMLLRDSWWNGGDASDSVINVVFYIPLGFCLFRGLQWSRLGGALAVLCAGLALSLSVEFVQGYEEERYSSLWDILANCSGTVLGVVLSEILRRGKNWWPVGRLIARPFIALLLAAWVGSVFLQPIPVCGRGLDLPAGAWLYSQIASVLAVALLLDEVVGEWSRRVVPPLIVAAVLVAGSLIQKAVPCPALIVGTAMALILWMTIIWKDSRRHFALCLFCAGGVVLERLQPWHFMSLAHGFEWVPFFGLIQAPPKGCVLMVLHDTFSLGILVWLLVRAGLQRRRAILVGTVVVTFVLGAKCFIPGTLSEISDLVILFGLAWMMVLTGEEGMIRC